MYKILVIDDEPGIVDGLVETLNREELELQVYGAYTVSEGLQIAKKVKLDILCTDINMPMMDGFEFASAVARCWKDCRILFLTGYDTFEYVYKAIHEYGANYVLKNEEDKFIEVIKKCIKEAELENKSRLDRENLLLLMDENKKNTKQRAWIEYLRSGEGSEKLKTLTDIYEDELDFNMPVKCAIGRLLRSGIGYKASERDLEQHFFKVREEYTHFYKLEGILLYNHSYLILAQEKVKEGPDLEEVLTGVQNALVEVEGQKVSFFYSEKYITFLELHEQVKLYNTLLDVKWSRNNPVFINLEDMLEENKIDDLSRQQYSLQIDKRLMERKFTELMDIFLALYLSVKNTRELSLADTQMYYKCIGIVASYVENYVNYSEMPEDLQRSYYHLRYMTGINEIHNFVMSFLQYMDGRHEQKEKVEDDQVVQKVESYVMNHITEEITLNSLARLVYFNPSYLSRFYKAATGKNLSRFIKDAKMLKAIELLEKGDKKIEDISRMLGFESAGYFAVMFKKQVGMTPTEYRTNKISKENKRM